MKKAFLSLMMGLVLLSGFSIAPPQPQEQPPIKLLDHNGWGG
ncbi:hypothetical protein ACJ7K1_04990 [Paenibacillus elgii]